MERVPDMSDDDKYLNGELLINARKPEGELGSELIDMMNENHEGLAQWSLSHLNISKNDVVLDVGCGGGVNIERFLKMTEAKVFGIDYSKLAVERSVELNRKAIDEGKCEIIQGSVSNLPFEDDSFNIVTAFETVYFWPEFENDLKEILRVLKDGGIFFIANETVPNENDSRQKDLIELLDMNLYSEDEFKRYLLEAGFLHVTCFTKDSKDSFTGDDADWICVIAKK